MRTTMIWLALVCVGGCVGGGSDDVTNGRVLLSDGSRGGDLVEAQMRATAEDMACIDHAGFRDTFWNILWPEGQAECLRDAINRHDTGNELAIECATSVYQALTDCKAAARCIYAEDPNMDCDLIFANEFQDCPQADSASRHAMDACLE